MLKTGNLHKWIEMVGSLLPCIPERPRARVLQAAWSAACGIEDEYGRGEALAGLAPHVPSDWLVKTLHRPQHFQNVRARAKMLILLAPSLSDEFRLEALREALAIVREYEPQHRAEILAEIALHAPGYLVALDLKEMLTDLRMIEDEKGRAKALARLASRLPADLAPAALAVAREIGDRPTRDGTLVALMPHFPEGLLWEILALGQRVGDAEVQVAAQASLAPHLPEAILRAILPQVREIKNAEAMSNPTACLALRLVDLGHVEEALEHAQRISGTQVRADSLKRMAVTLLDRLGSEECLAVIGRVADALDRAEMLLAVEPRLPVALQAQALQAALSAARCVPTEYASSPNEYRRGKILCALAPRLTAMGTPDDALAITRTIGEPYDQAMALSKLAPFLPDDLLSAALDVTHQIRPDYRGEALAGLASRLPTDLLRQEMQAALELDGTYGSKTLAILAQYLSGDLALEALAALHTVSERTWIASLEELIPRLAAVGHLAAAMETLKKLEDRQLFAATHPWHSESVVHRVRAIALAKLAACLPDDQKAKALSDALDAARRLPIAEDRMEAMAAAAPRLPEALKAQVLREAVAAVGEMRSSDWSKRDTLAGLLPHMSDDLLQELLQTARASGGWNYLIQALVEYTPNLPETATVQVLSTALAAVLNIRFEHPAKELAFLAPKLALLPVAALFPLWRKASSVLAARQRRDLLSGLGALEPVIASLGGQEAATGAYGAIRDVGRWWP